MNKNKKINVKNYLLGFIETFSIWQMGIIYYSSKTLTINSLNPLPVELDNSLLIIFLGYIIGILFIYFFPKKTIITSRIIMIISFISSIILFFNIPSLLFKILYYILTFNCVVFISLNASILVNLYSLKSALMDAIIGSIVVGISIALVQNNIFPFNFTTFNTISCICIFLITFTLFKLPLKMETNFTDKKTKIQIPPKKIIIGLIIIQALCSLITLFTSSLSESLTNGVALSYLGLFTAGLIAYIFYRKNKLNPFQLCKHYFGICSLGFVLYLIPNSFLNYIGLLFQGFGIFNILISPFLMSNLFEIYPSKAIAPVMIAISLIAVMIDSLLLELFRNNSTLLYLIYSSISIIAVIVYLMIEPNLELQTLNKKQNQELINDISNLSKREIEVASLLVKGYSNKEIASELTISTYTVNDHVKNIYRKTNTHSRIELASLVNNNRL